MANQGGKIFANSESGVRLLQDVCHVLGTSETDLGKVCRSSLVNKWSKYKPIRCGEIVPKRAPVNETPREDNDDFYKANYGITAIGGGNQTKLANAFSYTYDYAKPLGGNNPPQWYRLGDFNGYNHNAAAEISGQFFNAPASPILQLGLTFSIQEDNIKFTDLVRAVTGWSDLNLFNCYVGVVLSSTVGTYVKLCSNAQQSSLGITQLGNYTTQSANKMWQVDLSGIHGYQPQQKWNCTAFVANLTETERTDYSSWRAINADTTLQYGYITIPDAVNIDKIIGREPEPIYHLNVISVTKLEKGQTNMDGSARNYRITLGGGTFQDGASCMLRIYRGTNNLLRTINMTLPVGANSSTIYITTDDVALNMLTGLASGMFEVIITSNGSINYQELYVTSGILTINETVIEQ